MNSIHLVVLGSGLIGASLAKAAKKRNVVGAVTVVNRCIETSNIAVDLGIADQAKMYDDLPAILSSLKAGDVVVVSVPVNSYSSVFEQIGDLLPDGVALTDVGSTKVTVIDDAKAQWGDSLKLNAFVPGHPIAGSEQSGVEAANGDLYLGRRVILTPLESTEIRAVNSVRQLWEAVGAEVDLMCAPHHDEILAATSHLPHLLAYGLVDSLVTLEEQDREGQETRNQGIRKQYNWAGQKSEVFRYAAGGFRDFTRIAQSDPVMWRDIFLSNKTALVNQLENFESHLAELREAIEQGDEPALEKILERAQAARKHYSEMN